MHEKSFEKSSDHDASKKFLESKMDIVDITTTNKSFKSKFTNSKFKRQNNDGNLNTFLRIFKVFGIDICNAESSEVERFIASTMRFAMKFNWLSSFATIYRREKS